MYLYLFVSLAVRRRHLRLRNTQDSHVLTPELFGVNICSGHRPKSRRRMSQLARQVFWLAPSARLPVPGDSGSRECGTQSSKSEVVEQNLAKKMQTAAQNLDFEKALLKSVLSYFRRSAHRFSVFPLRSLSFSLSLAAYFFLPSSPSLLLLFPSSSSFFFASLCTVFFLMLL